MEKRRYEMVVVADPGIPEAAHDKEVTLLENMITELGGEICKVDVWGRMKLAYQIGNHTEGNYSLYLYDGAPDVEKELLRRIKLSDKYIRFLSVRADHEKAPTSEELEQLAESRKEHIRRAEERAAEAAAPPPPATEGEAAGGEKAEAAPSASAEAPSAPAETAAAPAETAAAPAETAAAADDAAGAASGDAPAEESAETKQGGDDERPSGEGA